MIDREDARTALAGMNLFLNNLIIDGIMNVFRTRAVDASPNLRNKRDFIGAFVDSVSAGGEVDEEWQAFVAAPRNAEVETINESEGRRPDATRAFIKTAFPDGSIQTTGTAVTKILPPVSRFAADGSHSEEKQRVLTRPIVFFDRFFGISLGKSE